MKKLGITVESDDVRYALDSSTLIEAKKLLDSWITQYGENSRIRIDEEYEYGETYCRVRIEQTREETDEEYSTRIAKESTKKRQQEERERAEFERLQAKFGEQK